MHVVIVGGGFGGLEAAKALGNTAARVTLIDRHNYHLFQPLLYQVAVAGLASEDVAAPIRHVLRRYRNVSVRLGAVEEVDLDRRVVRLEDGEEIGWDRLILAAGARTSYFGHDEWEADAPGLKSIPDALEIRRRVLSAFERAEWSEGSERERDLTFVVVGGGPTGVELAGAIAEIACYTLRREFRHVDTGALRVVLVEMRDHVLPPYPDRLREKARQMLEELGVEVRTGSRVEVIDADGIVVDGERIAAATVLWGAGVQAVSLTRQLGVPLDRMGRAPVRPDLSLPDHPHAFAVGDLAAFEQDGQTLPGVAQVAIQQGKHAAANVLADLRGRPRRPFRYKDRGSLATIGRQKAVADLGWLRTGGTFAWLLWVVVHLFWLVGFGNRATVFLKWTYAWFTWRRSGRIIWKEPDVRALIPEGEGPTAAVGQGR